MRKISATGCVDGIAIGRILYFKKNRERTEEAAGEYSHRSPAEEIERFRAAAEACGAQLNNLYETAQATVGKESAAIFDVHRMLLEDHGFLSDIEEAIRIKGVTAERAVSLVKEKLTERFLSIKDDYLNARVDDLSDICMQLIGHLSGKSTPFPKLTQPVILVCDDLLPSETVSLDKENLLAIVTDHGSANSHTSILARSLGIPSLVGVRSTPDFDGRCAVVDGEAGLLILDPTEDVLSSYRQKKEQETKEFHLLQKLKSESTITADGVPFCLMANIGRPEDMAQVLDLGADGIGLFRTEFLFLGQDTCPSEEEQFLAYRSVAGQMGEKPVVIRTLDIGADKQAACFDPGPEDNPAMGMRGIRISLKKPDYFRTQLRAILRASAYGNVSVLFPLVTSLWEVKQAKEHLAKVKEELRSEHLSFREDLPVGVMIETPAAAILSADLAKEADFFSIGTNDLTQYTLAIDRGNSRLNSFLDPHHPAVLRLIEMTLINAHRARIPVTICGELGADPTLTPIFLRMGVDELSVSLAAILPMRKRIREIRIN